MLLVLLAVPLLLRGLAGRVRSRPCRRSAVPLVAAACRPPAPLKRGGFRKEAKKMKLSLLEIVELAIRGLIAEASEENPLKDGRRYWYEARLSELSDVRAALRELEQKAAKP